MLLVMDPVEHGIYGLTGVIHDDYRSEVIGKQELGWGCRRIYLRLVDDRAKPEGARRKPTLTCTVIVPDNLGNHLAYRREMWSRIQNGGSLEDIIIQ